MANKHIDIAGTRFGYLVALKIDEKSLRNGAHWCCQCDCGRVVTIKGYNLRNGLTKSCGCKTVEMVREKNTKHGNSHAPGYQDWINIHYRTGNPKYCRYEHYKDRAPNASFTFEAFIKAIGPKPGPGYSVDRIRNEEPYALDNVRWATPLEQRITNQILF